MKVVIASLALLLLGISFQAYTVMTAPAPDQLPAMMRYAGSGYNALDANPDGEFFRAVINPGIRLTRFIFRLSCSGGSQIPDQVAYTPFTICSRDARTEVFTGQTSYQEKLSRSVDFSLIGVFQSIISAQFSLSDTIQEMRQKTENERSVVIQDTTICNYGEVRYKTANALNNTPGYDLTSEFMNAVRPLPSAYSEAHYMQFLDDWGTHIIERTSVGTREITRKRATYMDVYEYSNSGRSTSSSLDINAIFHGGTSGGGSSLSINREALESHINSNSELGVYLNDVVVGTEDRPVPTDISVISILQALDDSLWPSNERPSIQTKRTNLERALRNYVAYKQAHIAADPSIILEFQWPRGQFSLVKPASGCPTQMSVGWRYQDNQDVGNRNTWGPYDCDSCVDIVKKMNTKTYYCTKESESGSPSWPNGKYCIAKHGSSCPTGFREGSIYWDDEDNGNDNAIMEPVPSGHYTINTKINFCCRSDGNHNTPITLPPTEPFALYRYHGRCQAVRGMNTPMELFMHTDDEDSNNDNYCRGSHPDASCNNNQKLYYCYYTPQVMNNCRMNPCTNGYTTCTPTGESCNAYTCRCERNSSETHCLAKLRVKALYGRNLRRGPRHERSDPFMKITAHRLDGPPLTKKTRHKTNDNNPDWNEWFNFGRGQWKRIEVSIWDEDFQARDDRLCNDYSLDLLMGGYNNRRFPCFDSGEGVFNYRLTI